MAQANAKAGAWLAGICGALTAVAAPAQPSSLRRVPASPGPEIRRFDGVLGIFGDKAVLESSIASDLSAQIEGELNAGHRVTPEQIEFWRYQLLHKQLDEEALAQSARSLRGTTRDQVDRLVDERIEEFLREEERKAGSINRLTQELGFLGQTLESMAEDQRTELMGKIAWQQHVARRYQDSWALAVTPAEMRAYYEAHRSDFVAEPSADVEILAVAGGEDPRGRATRVTEAWRTGRPVEELAAELGAIQLDTRIGVRDAAADPTAAAIKEFAGRARAGEVSDPIPQGDSFWVLRARAVHPGRRDLFSDARVQAFIQRKLSEDLLEQDRLKLIESQRSKRRFVPTARRAR